jgi:uncharacterized damage-inducible protein DinB
LAGSALLAHHRRFARYNAWANSRLFDACSLLADTAYYAERPSFFGSIHRTLNHVLVGDRIWLGRFLGTDEPAPALDAELYADRHALRAARQAEDARLIAFVDGLDAQRLAAAITYRNTRGERFTQPLAELLAHLFNHQTHHRGQVHGMLSATPVAPPPLDLIYFLRTGG